MATTPNGFPVLEPSSPLLTTITVGKSKTPIRVAKPYAKAVKYLCDFLDALEPITEPGWDGGYAHRMVRGSTSAWSEHSAGGTVDWNASQHPMGVAGYPGWNVTQVEAIRWFLAHTSVGRLFEWGADYKRPDSMHFSLKDRVLWDAAVKAEAWFTR